MSEEYEKWKRDQIESLEDIQRDEYWKQYYENKYGEGWNDKPVEPDWQLKRIER